MRILLHLLRYLRDRAIVALVKGLGRWRAAPDRAVRDSSPAVLQGIEEAQASYRLGDWAGAERLARKVLDRKADSFAALRLLGNIAAQTGRPEEGYALLSRAIELNPERADALNELGIVLQELGRVEAALEAYERAIRLEPDYAEAHVNLGNSLADLHRYEAALVSYERAIALKPTLADWYINRGNALSGLGNQEAALASYDRAIALRPGYAEAYSNRGETLREMNRPELALESFEQALQLKPDHENLYGLWLHTKMTICDWSGAARNFSWLTERVERHERVSQPFPVLALSGSAALQRTAAETWVRAMHPTSEVLPAIAKRPIRDRIRLGYFSADFHDHATLHLMAELFEQHDRSRFELTAFSFGPDREDDMRRRAVAAFDNFVDARSLSDQEVALRSRDLGIDIAIDLKGFSQDSRTGIFALRAAPVQVNYLGYPGTMGAEYIDYLIADATLIPEGHRKYYSEKIAYLPHSYQANDTKRPISTRIFTRQEVGLPRDGFVFCCFNNNFKIVPEVFDIWMRILARVANSVLWLLEGNPRAADNLRKEASARGIDPARLVFAKRMPPPEHLARHRLADLFLDTLPCNAHTTASDALWAGLPVLTCAGETFAGRVAASLLNGILLPELVTQGTQEYEHLAVALATSPGRMAQLRQRLDDNRSTAPLFDIRLFAQHLEAAYVAMYERYRAGEPPAHIYANAEQHPG